MICYHRLSKHTADAHRARWEIINQVLSVKRLPSVWIRVSDPQLYAVGVGEYRDEGRVYGFYNTSGYVSSVCSLINRPCEEKLGLPRPTGVS